MAFTNNGVAGFLQATADGATQATMGGLFKLDATGSSGTVLMFNGDSGANGWGFYVPSWANTIGLLLGGVALLGITPFGYLTSGTWRLLTVTRNGSNYQLLVDADAGSAVNGTGTAVTPSPSFNVLGQSGASSPPNITASQCFFYPSVLTSGQLAALNARIRPPKVLLPKYYWPLTNSLQELVARSELTTAGTAPTATQDDNRLIA